jgi:hypothetical protein
MSLQLAGLGVAPAVLSSWTRFFSSLVCLIHTMSDKLVVVCASPVSVPSFPFPGPLVSAGGSDDLALLALTTFGGRILGLD